MCLDKSDGSVPKKMSDLSKSEFNETRNYHVIGGGEKKRKKNFLRAGHEICYKSITNMLQKYHKRITKVLQKYYKRFKKRNKSKKKGIFTCCLYTSDTNT